MQHEQENVVLLLVGSQFCAKVLCALDACKVPYRVRYLEVAEMKQVLQPPHTVPQMQLGGEYLVDSAAIMRKIDDISENSEVTLIPKGEKGQEVVDLEAWIGRELNAYVLYFTYWVEEGFWRHTTERWLSACLGGCRRRSRL